MVEVSIPSGYICHIIVDMYPNRRLRVLPKLLGSEFYPTAEEEIIKAQEAEAFPDKGKDSSGEPGKPDKYMLYMDYDPKAFNKPPKRYEDLILSVEWEEGGDDCEGKGRIVFYNDKSVRDTVKMYSEIRIYVQWIKPDGKLAYGPIAPDINKQSDPTKKNTPSFTGYIKNIIYTPREIECELVSYGVLLKQSPEGSFNDKKRSYVISKLITACGLTPDVTIPKDCDDKISFSLTTASTSTTPATDTTGATTGTATGTEQKGTLETTGTIPQAPVDQNVLQTNNPYQSRGQYVTAVGKPTCSYCKSYQYRNYKSTFVNYCPLCKHKGVLYFTTGKHGKQDAPDGQLTCTNCDGDFCIVCGSEKMKPKRGTLTKVSGPTPTEEPVGGAPTESPTGTGGTTTPETAWDAILKLCQESGCIIYPIIEGETVRIKPLKETPTADYDLKMTRDFIEGTLKVDERNPLVSNSVMIVYGDKTNPKVYIVDGAGARSAKTLKETQLSKAKRESDRKKEVVARTVADPVALTATKKADRDKPPFGVDTRGIVRLSSTKLSKDEVDAVTSLINAGGDYGKLEPKYKTTLEKSVKEGRLTPTERMKIEMNWSGHAYVQSGKKYTYTLHAGSGFENVNPYVVVSAEATNDKDARKVAARELWRMLSESGWEATVEVVYNPSLRYGRWAYVDFDYVYPAGRYYIESVSVKSEADRAPTATMVLKDVYALAETKKESESGAMNLDQIGQAASQFGYERGKCSDAQCLEQTGKGDCWAMSEWLYNKLTSAGVKARVVEYATAMSSRHRSVQVYQDGAWVDFPYKKYNIHPYFHATQGASSGKVVMGG